MAYAHGDVPVVASLRGEADAAAGAMLEALLVRLRGPVQLPECLRVIGYLRRLAVFDEQVLTALRLMDPAASWTESPVDLCVSSATWAAWLSDEQAHESSQLSLSTAVIPFGCPCDSSMVISPWLAGCLPESRGRMELGGTACTKQPNLAVLCRNPDDAGALPGMPHDVAGGFHRGPGGRAAFATVTVMLLAKTPLCIFWLSRHFHMFCRAGAAGAVPRVPRGVAGGPRRGSGGGAALRDAAPPDRRAPAAPL